MKLEREDSGRRSILARLRTTGKEEAEEDILITQDPETDVAANPSAKATGGTKLSYHWSEVPTNEEAPCNRSKHATCVHDGSLFLYGGRDVRATRKDLWQCDLRTNQWSSLPSQGEAPSLLQEHSMVAYKGRLYLFGGSLGCSDDSEMPLWIYNIQAGSWRNHQPESEVKIPIGRRCHTAVISHNSMHIYGGYIDLKGSSGELWTFVFENGHWHLSSDGQTNPAPLPRHSHSAVVHDGNMWVYGGLNNLHPLGDLWKWNFEKRAWSRVRFRSGPPELSGHSAVKAAHCMLVFGGQDSTGTLRQDMWRFSFANQTWDKIIINRMWPSPRTQLTFTSLVTFNLQAATPATRTWSVPFFLDHVGPTPDDHRPRTSPASVEEKRFRNRIHPVFPNGRKRDISPQRLDEGDANLHRMSPVGWCSDNSNIDIQTQNIWQAKENSGHEDVDSRKDLRMEETEKACTPSKGMLGDVVQEQGKGDAGGQGKASIPGFIRTSSVESIQISSRLQFSATPEIIVDECPDSGSSERNLLVPSMKNSQSFPDGIVNRKRKTLKHEKVGIENAAFVGAEIQQSLEDLQLEDLEDSAALDAEFSRYHGSRASHGNRRDSYGNRQDLHSNRQDLNDSRTGSLGKLNSYGFTQSSKEPTSHNERRKVPVHRLTATNVSSSSENQGFNNSISLPLSSSSSSLTVTSSAASDRDSLSKDSLTSRLPSTSGFTPTSAYDDSEVASAFMPCMGVTSVVALGGRTAGVHYANKPLSVWKLDVTPLQ
ncbi:PREDICTED: uncharacterized protein LOC109478145 [Branchiostoma belcheri]|uniref:Uncharacterized protein LOC109478145 n=1 Tax=Branchiostoma belcheri TaxID=7741 RepID=A0A6P4ZEP3_BRABE|nr:PREDICTED: uncharacterized protein LOC109478145 [Branchiostoma belcheri]